MGTKRTELTNCHDCLRPISFRAVSCPHCGSAEPTGPYVFGKKEARRLRLEQRNDDNLLVTTVACTAGGALYGVLVSSNVIGAIAGGFGYGLVGLLAGVPVAFAINMTRGLLR
jgi:hypothetical protein